MKQYVLLKKQVAIAKLIFLMFISNVCFGQAPNSFKYQAVIRDETGAVLKNTEVTIEIHILQGSATGTSVFSETHHINTNEFGIVNLNIGSENPAEMASVNWASGSYYIKVLLDGTEMGASELLSVPYALYAANSGNSDGVKTSGDQSISGTKTFTESIVVPTPTGDTEAANKAYVDASATTGWKTSGNASTDTSIHFIGTLDNQPVVFKINDTVKMILNENGNLAFDNTGGSVLIGKGAGENSEFHIIKNNVFIGDSSGYLNTTGNKNTGVGSRVLYHNINGYGNAAYGYSSLSNNTSGYYNTGIGAFTLDSNSTGFYNTGLGSYSLHNNKSGNYNTAVGSLTLYFNQDGNQNTANGYNALRNNTSGSFNIAFGAISLYNNVSGHSNTAVGQQTLYSNLTGYNNTAIGRFGLAFNTEGNDNTAVGVNALWRNTSGNANTACGNQALLYNSTGDFNVGVGIAALYSNHTGYSNIAIGVRSLFYSTIQSNIVAIGDSALYKNGLGATSTSQGSKNVAIGSKALYSNTTGYSNTAVGYQALKNSTTSNANVAFGTYSMYNNITGEHNTALGYSAMSGNTTGSSSVAIGHLSLYNNTTGTRNVLSGEYSAFNNTIGSYLTGTGYHALYNNSTGNYNTGIGYCALTENTTGSQNIAVGSYAGPAIGNTNLVNTVAIGYSAKVYASNTIRLGNSSITSIGGYAPWTTLSDGRFKTNIKNDVPGLEFVMKLRPVTYNWNLHKLDEFIGIPDSLYSDNPELDLARNKKEEIIQTGFIAQEVEEAAKACGYEFSGVIKPENEKSQYTLSYAEFVVPLVKAIQEQQEIINQQQEMIQKLTNDLNQLKQAIENQ